nr:MAG TPA: INFECTIVITY PROTEIN G3P, FILAMENTOUS PHAGE, PILUS BINDING.9A [Caudoviricetes sp.]
MFWNGVFCRCVFRSGFLVRERALLSLQVACQ